MQLFRDVRAVFVRHLIDLGRIVVQISMGGVHLRGSLARLPGATTPLTPETVQAIINEIRRIRGVKRIVAELDNWSQAGSLDAWLPKTPAKHTPKAAHDDRTYNLGAGGPASGD